MIRRLAFLFVCMYSIANARPEFSRDAQATRPVRAPPTQPNPPPNIAVDGFNNAIRDQAKYHRTTNPLQCGEEGNGQTIRIILETSGSSVREPKKKTGTTTIDFGTHSTASESGSGLAPPIHGLPRLISSQIRRERNPPRRIEDEKRGIQAREELGSTTTTFEAEAGKVTTSIDLANAKHVIPILANAGSTMADAAVGTLRLLAPLIVARRLLNAIGYFCKDIVWNFPVDYLTGLYLRKTYTRLERAYLRYYELPSALRASARTSSQIFTLFFLSGLVGWMYGVGEPPCREEGMGLSLLCGLLWIGAVVTTGHAFASAVSVWGGPLRLQISSHPKNKQVYTRPSHILQWVQDLEEWTSMMSTHEEVKAFDPNPLIFPFTWLPLRLLTIFAVAKALNTDPSSYRWCSSNVDQVPKLMKQFLIQLSLGDEWHRVFLVEKRVGLGVLVAVVYFIALAVLIATTFTINGAAAALMIPSLLAVIVSGWMNIVIFFTRLDVNKKEAAIKELEKRKQTAIGAFKLGNTYYN